MRNTVVRAHVTRTNAAGMSVGSRARVAVENSVFSNNHADVGYGYDGAVATGRASKLLAAPWSPASPEVALDFAGWLAL
jgi:hypothetical protein